MFGLIKRRRRKRLRQQSFPEVWKQILLHNVAYYRELSPEERDELHGHIHVLLAEKHFEGCGGLTITDEIRVTIAGLAALLLLGRDTDYFPKMSTILVYPSHYYAETTQRLAGGIVAEGMQSRLGESWYRGPVVLSWEDVLRGAHDAHDWRNVVIHEFAHQLDSEWGGLEGAPALPDHAAYADWSRVFGGAYERLRRDVAAGRATFIDPYGATSPAEFFAVVTESFFERPRALLERHPDLYEQLRRYFKQDPAHRG